MLPNPRGAEWQLDLPREWKTADWDTSKLEVIAELPAAGAVLVNAMLADGTNLIGMLWPGGQRLVRCTPDGVDERFGARLPKKHRKVLSRAWRVAVKSLVAAKQAAERELGPPVVRTHRDRARWLLSDAPGAAKGLRYAYEALDRPDISFDDFRRLIEHEAGWEDVA